MHTKKIQVRSEIFKVKHERALHNYFIPCHRKYTVAHAGEVGCNTVEYSTAFLYSDWLYFLWNGIKKNNMRTVLDSAFVVIWVRIRYPRSFGSRGMNGTDKSTLSPDSSTHLLCLDPCDLGSLMLARIIPKGTQPIKQLTRMVSDTLVSTL